MEYVLPICVLHYPRPLFPPRTLQLYTNHSRLSHPAQSVLFWHGINPSQSSYNLDKASHFRPLTSDASHDCSVWRGNKARDHVQALCIHLPCKKMQVAVRAESILMTLSKCHCPLLLPLSYPAWRPISTLLLVLLPASSCTGRAPFLCFNDWGMIRKEGNKGYPAPKRFRVAKVKREIKKRGKRYKYRAFRCPSTSAIDTNHHVSHAPPIQQLNFRTKMPYTPRKAYGE
jgi:hypothetical protein